eukprot:365323-Chlamydomonas_euryale.AAC.22
MAMHLLRLGSMYLSLCWSASCQPCPRVTTPVCWCRFVLSARTGTHSRQHPARVLVHQPRRRSTCGVSKPYTKHG